MELTLRPGRHEIIERQNPVHEWRVARLARLGIPWPVAEARIERKWSPAPQSDTPGGAGCRGTYALVQGADEGNR